MLKALEVTGCHAAVTAMEATWSRDARQKSSVYTTAETVVEAYANPGVLANSMRFDVDAGASCSTGAATPSTSVRPPATSADSGRCS